MRCSSSSNSIPIPEQHQFSYAFSSEEGRRTGIATLVSFIMFA